jgi:hypothetical protein
MKRLTQIALVGVLVLAVASLATAQRAPEPVVRVGNFFEVGNDVFMHLIAATEMHYDTVENRDFEKHVRDRVDSRFPDDTAAQVSDSDAAWFQNRLGVELRYQKNLEMYLLFQHRQFVDGNLIDDRSNSTNIPMPRVRRSSRTLSRSILQPLRRLMACPPGSEGRRRAVSRDHSPCGR